MDVYSHNSLIRSKKSGFTTGLCISLIARIHAGVGSPEPESESVMYSLPGNRGSISFNRPYLDKGRDRKDDDQYGPRKAFPSNA